MSKKKYVRPFALPKCSWCEKPISGGVDATVKVRGTIKPVHRPCKGAMLELLGRAG